MLPVETFSITAGIKGGIAGGIAMVVPATLFSLLRYHSLWYAVNLLAAGGFVSWAGESNAFLAQFHLQGLLAALGIHGVASLLVGLLYGAMLPMFPRKPILTAGFIAPFLWTGLIYSALGVISPILNERIDWLWFVVSQIAFGLVCGFVVNLQVKVRTPQFRALPFAVRAGLHGDQTLTIASTEEAGRRRKTKINELHLSSRRHTLRAHPGRGLLCSPRLQPHSRPPRTRPGGRAPRRGPRLPHALQAELRRLPRRKRQKRRGHLACQSRLLAVAGESQHAQT